MCLRRQNKFFVIYDTNNGAVRTDRNLFIYMYVSGLITLNAFTPSEIAAEAKQYSDDSTTFRLVSRWRCHCFCKLCVLSVGKKLPLLDVQCSCGML